jgi:hypothetical protein
VMTIRYSKRVKKITIWTLHIIRYFDANNRGNMTYINSYKVVKFNERLWETRGKRISPRTIMDIYKTLTCVAETLGGWYAKLHHGWVFALPHSTISKMSDAELMGIIFNCVLKNTESND